MDLSTLLRQWEDFWRLAPSKKVRERNPCVRSPRLAGLEGRPAVLGVLAVAVITCMAGYPALAGAAPPAGSAPSGKAPAAGAHPAQAGGAEEDDGSLDVIPLLDTHGWIRVEYAPVFRSGTPTLTGECEVKGVGAIAPFHLDLRKRQLVGIWQQTTEGEFEQVCKTVDRTAPPLLTTCTIKKTWIVKAEIVGGKIAGGKKPKRLDVISLKIQDHAKKTETDCEVCTPQGCTTTHTEDEGEASRWWPMALYRWPLAEGHSETLGRFTYTLLLLEK
jgi:hypothetical protein